MKNITGENNKLVFVLKDGSEVTEFTGKETELLENFPLMVQGNNNMVRIKVDKRDDIEKFLNKKGLAVYMFGHNNTVNIGKLLCPTNPALGLTGLAINIGNPPEDTIEPGVNRYASNCNINICDNVIVCGARLFLQDDNSSISIGNDCMISWGIDFWCTDVHTITDLEGNPLNFGKSIEIGNHVWIGRDVKIGKNTKISDDSIVGWASVVTKKFDEPNVIVAGNPARIVKREINWDFHDLQNYQLNRMKKNC